MVHTTGGSEKDREGKARVSEIWGWAWAGRVRVRVRARVRVRVNSSGVR